MIGDGPRLRVSSDARQALTVALSDFLHDNKIVHMGLFMGAKGS